MRQVRGDYTTVEISNVFGHKFFGRLYNTWKLSSPLPQMKLKNIIAMLKPNLRAKFGLDEAI